MDVKQSHNLKTFKDLIQIKIGRTIEADIFEKNPFIGTVQIEELIFCDLLKLQQSPRALYIFEKSNSIKGTHSNREYEIMKACIEWKQLSNEEKSHYEKKYKEHLQQWSTKTIFLENNIKYSCFEKYVYYNCQEFHVTKIEILNKLERDQNFLADYRRKYIDYIVTKHHINLQMKINKNDYSSIHYPVKQFNDYCNLEMINPTNNVTAYDDILTEDDRIAFERGIKIINEYCFYIRLNSCKMLKVLFSPFGLYFFKNLDTFPDNITFDEIVIKFNNLSEPETKKQLHEDSKALLRVGGYK